MRLADIPAPADNKGGLEIRVPCGKHHFARLMRHLERVGWTWGDGSKPTAYTPLWAGEKGGFVHLWTNGTITQSAGRCVGYNPVEVDDWDREEPKAVAGTGTGSYCACASPKVERRFAGIGSAGSWYDFCTVCRRERA